MIRKLLVLLFLIAGGAGPAHAEWREASSPNFLVYGEASEAELRAFAEKLEKFDFVLRRFHRVQAPPSPNKLRIILVPNQGAVAALAGAPGAGIAGYYVSHSRAMMMVGSRNDRASSTVSGGRGERGFEGLDSESVLLHEYTHHFMYQYFPATYPTWYSEGFAEFWGATRFAEDGTVEVGRPANHRFLSFFENRWMPASELLEAQNYGDVREVDLLYAQGWLLVRYAWENPARQRQLQTYLNLVNKGISYKDAATQAFGDVGKLNSELREYSGKSRYNVLTLPFRAIPVGEIKVRVMRAAEQAMFRHEIELSQGVSVRDFPEFAARVRRDAAGFPNDPFALRLLAEVERTAGNLPAAETAVNKLLAVAPQDARGLMFQGLLKLDAIRRAGGGSAPRFAAAREPIARAAALQPNDPLILEALYNSYPAIGGVVPEEAQAHLYRAMELAPSDADIRLAVAADFEARGMIPEAIATIRPGAYRVPDRREESDKERARREQQEDRNRRAGTARRENARQMLERLLKKQQETAAAD